MRVIVSPGWFPDGDFSGVEEVEAESEKDAAGKFARGLRGGFKDPSILRVKTRAISGGPVTVWEVRMERRWVPAEETRRIHSIEHLTTIEVAVA